MEAVHGHRLLEVSFCVSVTVVGVCRRADGSCCAGVCGASSAAGRAWAVHRCAGGLPAAQGPYWRYMGVQGVGWEETPCTPVGCRVGVSEPSGQPSTIQSRTDDRTRIGNRAVGSVCRAVVYDYEKRGPAHGALPGPKGGLIARHS